MINGSESEIMNISHVRLSQSSLLSSILFLFYNADLVAERLLDLTGIIVFVNDFLAWVVSLSIKNNIR